MTAFARRPLTIPTLLLSLVLLVAATTFGCAKKQPSASLPGATHVDQVQSDDPGTVSYDEGSRRLVVTFRSGSVYEYNDVPHNVYVGFVAAPARGVYFSTYVKDRYPFRVTTSGPTGSTVIKIEGAESKPVKTSRGRGRGR